MALHLSAKLTKELPNNTHPHTHTLHPPIIPYIYPPLLPPTRRWQASVGGVWTGAGDLGYAAFSTVALIFIRYGVERYIAKPIAIWGGISPNTRTAPLKNKVLEAAYKKSRKVPKNEMELEALVAKSGLESAREVERWCVTNSPHPLRFWLNSRTTRVP